MRDLEQLHDRPKQIAIHEAGHAVMHVLRDLEFHYVSIKCTDDSDGRVCPEPPDPAWVVSKDIHRLRDYYLKSLDCSLAGMLAMHRAGMPEHWDGAERDLFEARSIAQLLGGVRPEEFLELHRESTAQLLFDNWHSVEVVRDALLEREKLTSSEVREVMAMSPAKLP